MKNPTIKEWIAIILAALALITASVAALKDGAISNDEAADLKAKIDVLATTTLNTQLEVEQIKEANQ